MRRHTCRGLEHERESLASMGVESTRRPARAHPRGDRHRRLLRRARRAGQRPLHPGRYFAGLAAAADRAGADLHEGVRARTIRRQADGRFVVETERGAILARDVFVATNGYTDGVVPSLRRRIIPIGELHHRQRAAPRGPGRRDLAQGPLVLRHQELPVLLARLGRPADGLRRPGEHAADVDRAHRRDPPPRPARGPSAAGRAPDRLRVGRQRRLHLRPDAARRADEGRRRLRDGLLRDGRRADDPPRHEGRGVAGGRRGAGAGAGSSSRSSRRRTRVAPGSCRSPASGTGSRIGWPRGRGRDEDRLPDVAAERPTGRASRPPGPRRASTTSSTRAGSTTTSTDPGLRARRAELRGDDHARRARPSRARASRSGRPSWPPRSAIRRCWPRRRSRSTTSRAVATSWGWVRAGTSGSTRRSGSSCRRCASGSTASKSTVRVLKALFSDEARQAPGVSLDAPPWRLDGATMEPGFVRPGGPPLWLGGQGPRGLRIAARYADGWNYASNLDRTLEGFIDAARLRCGAPARRSGATLRN